MKCNACFRQLSSRRRASFIKFNCASIHAELLENELFGYEKGGSIGSGEKKIGRLELANKGTLFLDELGQFPLDLQSNLLRVLQHQEFERVGSPSTIRVDVRLIAATNQDLEKKVAEKELRRDLYYSLNVVPIVMAPLRERKEDIPLLVRHLVKKIACRMNKQIDIIPTETMNELVNWTWPENVRELENFIERSVIRSQGPILNISLVELRSRRKPDASE